MQHSDHYDYWFDIVWFFFISVRKKLHYVSSSSSCRTISTDISDPFTPPFSIIHCFRQVFRATSRIDTELQYVDSSWSSCLCSSMWRGQEEYVIYEFVPTSSAASCMSDSSKWIVFVMGGKWPYSCCFVGCCPQDLFNIRTCSLYIYIYIYNK